jgi:hypothetical protein
MKRRNLFLAAPALISTINLGSKPAAAQVQPTQEWSTLTYQPMVLQQQLAANQQVIFDKPFGHFFKPDMTVPTEAAKMLLRGPLELEQTLSPSVADINRLLDLAYKPIERGYALLEGDTLYVQSRTFFPGAHTDMLKWWFVWHPVENERYMLWYPFAHVANAIEDSVRLKNRSLSYEERLYNNPNYVTEYIGTTPIDIVINFKDPVELGFDKAALAKSGFTASASGTVSNSFVPDGVSSLMVHLGRNIDGGMELINRYWIGSHPELNRLRPKGESFKEKIVKMIAPKMTIDTCYEMAVHDMIEFHHLAQILPTLYQEFGQQS